MTERQKRGPGGERGRECVWKMKRENNAVVPEVLEKVVTVHHQPNEDMFKWG